MNPATLATPAGTEEFAAGADLVESAYAHLGRTGLVVSRLGFGGYRIDDRVPAHREALAAALLQGVNLIDTSTNYADGHSELLVGKVVAELFAADKATRDALVLVSKVGYAQGANLELAKEREERGEPFPELVKLSPELWHSISPPFIADQLGRSLARLGLSALDLLLLHNPEYFLEDAKRRGVPLADARAEFDDRLRRAFVQLEAECDDGRIAWYGVSSNTFAADRDAPEATSLERMLALASEAAVQRGKRPDEHRFAAIQLPLNLLEPAAALGGSDDGRPVIAVAKERGIAVLTNRPLNAFVANRLVRLAEPPFVSTPLPFAEAVEEVRAIEAIFAADFAPRIRVEGEGPKPEQLFRWGIELADAPEKLAGLEHWESLQARFIGPQTDGALNALARAFGQDPAFRAWGNRYVEALDSLFGAVTAELVSRARARADEIRGRLEPGVPATWRGASLSRQAIAAVLGADGVTTVLVGMRQKEYVEDALGAVVLPAPEGGIRALAPLLAEFS